MGLRTKHPSRICNLKSHFRIDGLRRWSLGRRPTFELLEARHMLSAVSWDGGGNGTCGNDTLNSSNNQLPTSADDVTIDVAGTPAITIDSGSQLVHSLT